MAFARSTIVFLVFSACLLFAQTTSQSVLKIRVQDAAMAFISNARIQIHSASSAMREIHADESGQGTLRLDLGEYSISVSALGFEAWKGIANITAGSDRSITVELMLGGTCSPCLTVSAPEEMQFEHFAPLVELPISPMEPLVLPAHHLRRRAHT